MSPAVVALMDHPGSIDPASAEYISRIQSGDIAAFEALFRTYYSRLLVFAVSYGQLSSEAAEDVVCEVMGWLWRHRENWEPRTSIEAYLYGAVRNKIQNMARDVRRDLQRRNKYTAWEDSPGSGERLPEADSVVERNEVREMVRVCVNDLPDVHRLIVLLRWDKQWSWQEIAEVVGVSSAAAQMQHQRALKTLRERLPKYFKP